MSAPERMHVGIYRSCDNTVAYQNVPVHRTDIDRSDGRLVDSVIYVRGDLHDTLRAESERLKAALRKAHTAMTLASALPGVEDEYDFEPAIATARYALNWGEAA